MIISFSGTDGSGKSSIVKILKKKLKKTKVVYFNRYIFLNFFLDLTKFFYKTKKNKKKKQNIFLKKNDILLFKFWPVFVILDNLLFYLYIKVLSIMGYKVLCDRYFIDKIVSYNYYGYSNLISNKLYIKCYFYSDKHFYLKSDLKLAKERETNNSHSMSFFKEHDKLYNIFHKKIYKNFYVINTNNNIDQVIKKILKQIHSSSYYFKLK